jgi:hypothetical protein
MTYKDTRTITVEGHFGGDIKLSKSDFKARWRNHAAQLKLFSADFYKEACKITKRVEVVAGEEFERMYMKKVRPKTIGVHTAVALVENRFGHWLFWESDEHGMYEDATAFYEGSYQFAMRSFFKDYPGEEPLFIEYKGVM